MIRPPPRHVLMTADTIGGLWNFALELCVGLSARGVRVTLVTFGRAPDQAQDAAVAALPQVELISSSYRLEWMTESYADVIASGEWLLRLVDDVKPDLVHANGFYHAALTFDVPVLLTAHSCVMSWWQACKGVSAPVEWDAYRRWVRAAVHRVRLLVAPSRAYLDVFQNAHGATSRARVICNGRDPLKFQPAAKRNVILAAGRVWDEAKNIAMLANIAPALDAPILVAGETIAPHGGALPLEGIKALGQIEPESLARLMAEAAIFAAPARYEPFGLSALEAALSGCALVLADIPVFRELWEGAATFVAPGDAGGWQRALTHLLRNPTRARAHGDKARVHAQRYTAARMVSGYCDAYATLLAAASRRETAA